MRNVALLAEPDSEIQADLRERLGDRNFEVVLCSSSDQYLWRLTCRIVHPTVTLANIAGEEDFLLTAFALWPVRDFPPLPPSILWVPGGERAVAEYMPYLASAPIKVLSTPIDPEIVVALAVLLTTNPYPQYPRMHDQIRRGIDCTARDPGHHHPRRM